MASTDPTGLARRAEAAAHWFTTLGHRTERVPGLASFTTDPARPDHWDANHAALVETDDPVALKAALDSRMAHTSWRVVRTGAGTPPAIEAALLLDGFSCHSTLIQMVAREPAKPAPVTSSRPVMGEADWQRLLPLVRADKEEGGDTRDPLPDPVVDAIVASYRRMTPAATFHLIEEDGLATGYGCTARAPNGLGLVEHLFMLPERRSRGIMAGFIASAGAALVAGGAEAITLGARAGERPRRLYARLGFRPVATTRLWVQRAG